jgi:hypothetical protein
MVHGLSDRSVVAFDDERVVANAGVLLPARLGIEGLIDARVDLGERCGGANPGRKASPALRSASQGSWSQLRPVWTPDGPRLPEALSHGACGLRGPTPWFSGPRHYERRNGTAV